MATIDAYIKTKDQASGADLIKKGTELSELMLPILDKYKESEKYHRAAITAAESEVTAFKDKNPYSDTRWIGTLRTEVNKFCCEIRSNRARHTILLKWLEDWLDKDDHSK
ncbi:MAG: hypothetical protein KF799_00760 [Bdellovibrionales bacterium]|nr:hypothetical protein [Bdellovibrionales bacterium]